MKNSFYLLALCLLILSCGKDNPVLDGEDQTGFNQSIEKLKETLPTLKKDKFSEAIQLVYDYNTKPADGNRWSTVRRLLDGKNADEIFTMAEQIASDNEINWHRNQAPYPSGLPSPKREKEEEVEVVEAKPKNVNQSIKEANSIDLNAEIEGNNIHLYPSFLRYDGTIIRFGDTLEDIVVEVFSDNTLVYSARGKQVETYRDSDPNFGGDGIVIPMKLLQKNKIKNPNLTVKARVPHPEKYLIQRTKITVPETYVGYEKNDSIKITEEKPTDETDLDNVRPEPKKKDKEEVVSTLITKRFIQNIKSNQLNKAYGLTKNPKWSSYKSFTSKDIGFGDMKSISNESVNYQGKQNNQATVNVSFDAKNSANESVKYKYKYTLTNENNQWFITDSQLISKSGGETPKPAEEPKETEPETEETPEIVVE